MNMIILNEEEVSELNELNSSLSHLNRAVNPIKLNDGSFAVVIDILDDRVTWEKWISFLSEKPTKDVSSEDISV